MLSLGYSGWFLGSCLLLVVAYCTSVLECSGWLLGCAGRKVVALLFLGCCWNVLVVARVSWWLLCCLWGTLSGS